MVRHGWWCVVTAVCVAVAGCGHREAKQQAPSAAVAAKPALKAPPATPLSEKKAELGGTPWDPAWSLLVEKNLPPELLGSRAARAVRSWCPRFAEESPAERRAFWAYVFQAMAGAESSMEPATVVHHTEAAVNRVDPVTRALTRQEGLLQLTYEDGRRYGCAFDWRRDRRMPLKDPRRTILQPKRNLDCGIRIMVNQVVNQGKPLLSRTSYWSTLQPGTASYQVFRRQMANLPQACRLTRPRRRARSSARAATK